MEPLGLVKDEYVRDTITTSSIPLYQTKNLGLTQYTPNRYTNYLVNYNEDMRKIDRFSTSIGSYIEKNLDDASAEHQRLDERINNTNSVLAFTEKRVDNVEKALTELQTDIAQVRVEIHEAVADSEAKMTELISQSIAATSSTLAYLDKKIDENDTKQTLAYSGLSQRMHVAEDEIKTLKESSASYLEDITNLQTGATNLENRVSSLEELEQVNHEDIVDAKKKLMAHDTELASLANTETVQNQTIAALTEQVAALNEIGADVNRLKSAARVIRLIPGDNNRYNLDLSAVSGKSIIDIDITGDNNDQIQYSGIAITRGTAASGAFEAELNFYSSANNPLPDVILMDKLELYITDAFMTTNTFVTIISNIQMFIKQLYIAYPSPGNYSGAPMNITFENITISGAVVKGNSQTGSQTPHIIIGNLEFTVPRTPPTLTLG